MANLWVKNASGTWVLSSINVRSSTGWKSGTKVFEKTGASTWTQRWAKDLVAPLAPTITYTANAAAKSYVLTITMPSAPDTNRMMIKYGHTGYPKVPSSAPETNATYYTALDPVDHTTWSERDVVPGQVVKRYSTSASANTPMYFSAWARDTSGNWSPAGTLYFKFPAVTEPTAPSSVAKTATYNCSDSGAYNDTENYWRTDNQYVYQGSESYWGMWFYGDRIRAALANAKTITKVTIRIQRVNSSHGVSGDANVYLSAHKYASQPAGSPAANATAGTLIGTLGRGEVGTYNVPSTWWDELKAGTYKGLGLRYSTSTSFTSVNYLYAYGAGTTSGQIHLEWTQ